MPLSPYETRILKRIEEDLRTDDPNLAAALSAPTPPVRRGPSMPLARRALGLVAVLIGLAAVSTFFGERLGVAGLGMLTCIVVMPWLVGAMRAGEKQKRTTEPTRESTSAGLDKQGTVEPPPTRRAALHLFVALVLVAVAVIPPAWSGVIPLVLMFVLLYSLPRLVERAVVWVERRRGRVRPGRSSR